MSVTYPLTIYYDASCPMCRVEMETLKEYDVGEKIILVDCANEGLDTPANCPVTREAMMERIHAQDATGVWIKGVDVFEAAYSAAGFSKLSKFWGSKSLRPLLSRAYPWVADNRQWLSKTPLPMMLNAFLRKYAK